MSVNLPAQLNDRLIEPIRRDLEEARGETLRAIASIDAGRQLLTDLLKPDIYIPTGKKEIIANLYLSRDGTFFGHARGADGRIVGQAKWLKVTGTSSRLLSSAGMLTGHLMLVEMSQKLDRIRGSLDAIRNALDDDRVQKIRAAIGGAKDAIGAKNVHNRQLLLTSTIPHLNEAVLQTIAALKREIAEIPLPPDKRIARVFIDREPKMRESIAMAERTFHACVEGISILGQTYIAIDERELGYRAVIRGLEELGGAGIANAEFRARLLKPSDVDDRPELIWGTFRQQLPELIRLVEIELKRQLGDPVEIDMSLVPSQMEAALECQRRTAE